ncbi:MAG: two-component regulator propeller domain-containing protein [Verrucomicrobiota bacterium]
MCKEARDPGIQTVGTPRCGVPARASAGGKRHGAWHALCNVAPLDAARTARRAVSTRNSDASALRALPFPALLLGALFLLLISFSAQAIILWSDLGETHVSENGPGTDILGGAVREDDASTNTLYFKLRVNPGSDASTEKYYAAFQLFEGDMERLGIGNSLEAWGYSAFNTLDKGESNTIAGDVDLHSSRPQFTGQGSFFPYELPHRGIEATIVFKVQYVRGGDDRVTVWLNPDLAPGATEAGQLESLTTHFRARAGFDQVRLRHGGSGSGWTFSDMAIATSFADFVRSGGDAGPAGGAGRVTFQSWQREQGLPQNSVRALLQTRDGYLWVGSDDGVARFDGMRFVSFGIPEGLASVRVNTLFEDLRGALWIGTAGSGLVRIQDNLVTTFTMRDGLLSDNVTALTQDGEGRLWVGTDAGLGMLLEGRFFSAAADAGMFRGKPVSALFKDRHGVIWIAAGELGVFQYLDGTFLPVKGRSVDELLQDPHCLLVDRAGRVWVGAGDDYVLCRDGGDWREYRLPRHLARPYVTALAEQPDGTVWAGSVSEGLFQFRDGKLYPVNASAGLSDNFVQSLLVDREGNLWIGTAAGLNRLRHSNLSVYGQNAGAVLGLAEVSPGITWVGKPSDGVYVWDERSFSPLDLPGLARPFLQVNCLLTNAAGCWVGTAHGLLQFTNPFAKSLEPLEALEGQNVIALAREIHGGLWVGTHEGMLWLNRDDGAWEQEGQLAMRRPISAIAQNSDGTLWIGTEGDGLYQFKEGVKFHFDKGARLLSGLIRTLYLDAQGTLWIGTAGGGLSRLRGGRIDNFTTHEGLPDNTISQILEDDRGRLWLGSNRGLASVAKRDLDLVIGGKIAVVYPQVYGRVDGMFAEECSSGFFPAGLKLDSGLLAFSTLKGIVVADPRPRSADVLPPVVVLEDVLVDGNHSLETRAISPPGGVEMRPAGAVEPQVLRIPAGKHRIDFQYTGLSFNAPERVRFRYQLKGFDPDWVDNKTDRKATYSYIPPGEYLFRVSACNSDGVWNDEGAVIKVVVDRHFWQAPWFIISCGLGLLGVVGGAVRLVEKRKIQRRLEHLEQERALARERARIAQDLHDDLGSSLARISLLSGLARADRHHSAQVEAHVEKIALSADETVRALEEIVWAVRPGSDTLQSLVEYIAHFANEYFTEATVRCRLNLPHDLPARPIPPEMRHNIFLIVKEALTNVLRHASAREVLVEAKLTGDSLEIVVQDDGQGFDAQGSRKERRNGLGNMQRRAEAMNGALSLESGPGKGTRLRLVVTLPAASAV